MTFNNVTSPIKQRRKPTVSVDWTDLASATGYVQYDCHNTKDTTGSSQILIETSSKGSLAGITAYSGTPIAPYCLHAGEIDQATYTLELDVDFDTTTFQIPRTVRGTAYISFYSNIFQTAGAAARWYMIVRIRKWDGAAETEIASVQGEEHVRVADQDLLHNFEITVPKTLIKKGEQLRITIEGWGKTASGSSWVTISGDPADGAQTDGTRTMAANKTRIITQIPYEINQ